MLLQTNKYIEYCNCQICLQSSLLLASHSIITEILKIKWSCMC